MFFPLGSKTVGVPQPQKFSAKPYTTTTFSRRLTANCLFTTELCPMNNFSPWTIGKTLILCYIE
jgi:hypothetical protein